MDHHAPTIWDRIGIGAVTLLLAAFALSAFGFVATAAADDLNGKRDDDAVEIAAKDDDDNDNDTNTTATGQSNGNSVTGNSDAGDSNGDTNTTATGQSNGNSVTGNSDAGDSNGDDVQDDADQDSASADSDD